MAQLTSAQKNNIQTLKKRLSRILLHANKIQNLNVFEKELLAEIMDEEIIDRIGNYEGRMKMLYKDIYICAGIIYWHTDRHTLLEICEPKPVTFQ